MQVVDLATGACAPQNNLLHLRDYSAAGRLADGRVICAGGIGGYSSAEVWVVPEQGAVDTSWTRINLPALSAGRQGCCGCLMSDGRFAVLGGRSNFYNNTASTMSSCEALTIGDGDASTMSSCEALTIGDGDAHWEPLPRMHASRHHFACGAIAGCVIVAGGDGHNSAELYGVELNRWLRLPCDLPYEIGLGGMGSAVL